MRLLSSALAVFVAVTAITVISRQNAASKAPESQARVSQLVKVVSVNVEGAEMVPEKWLQWIRNMLLQHQFPAASLEEEATKAIRVTLIRGGYVDTAVEKLTVTTVGDVAGSRAVREVAVTARVNPGELYHMSGVAVEGVEAATVTPQEVRDLIPFHPGDAVDTWKMLEGLAQIRKLYACRGYIKADPVPIVSFHRETRTEFLTVQMREGKEYEISSVRLEGFPDGVGDRLLTAPGLQAGDKFSSCKIRDGEKEILEPSLRLVMELTADDEAGRVAVILRPAADGQWDGQVIDHTSSKPTFNWAF